MPFCKATGKECDPRSKLCQNSGKHMVTINRMCHNLTETNVKDTINEGEK